MHHVLTVVSAPGALDEEIVGCVGTALANDGALVAAPTWVTSRTSVDIPFGNLAVDRAEACCRQVANEAAVDVDCLAQEESRRAKKLLVADLESTIIDNEMLDEMAAAIGVGEEVASITARAMRGELDFEASLAARLRLFRGQPTSLLEAVAGAIRLGPGAEVMVAGMRAAGVTTALVTGGFHVFADQIARRLGFDRTFANRLEIATDASGSARLTGHAVPPILDRDAKRTTLLALCRELEINPRQAVTIGDGANDLAMLAEAGLGIAYRAKPAVRGAARARIDHTGLDTVLDFVGARDGGRSEAASAELTRRE